MLSYSGDRCNQFLQYWSLRHVRAPSSYVIIMDKLTLLSTGVMVLRCMVPKSLQNILQTVIDAKPFWKAQKGQKLGVCGNFIFKDYFKKNL